MQRLAVLAAAIFVALTTGAKATAATVVRYDSAGRAMTFDVRTGGVGVNWYARLLRRSLHGDEIEDVVVRIVSPRRIASLCGSGADSCYNGDRGGGVVVVPAGRNARTAHLLVHEYAHHLDASYDLTSALEDEWPSWRTGARGWWTARGLGRLLAQGKVTWSYRLGWSRSIAEILAEDYARLELRSAYLIRWLAVPTRPELRALRSDIVDAIRAGTVTR
jgi:hypothetical protein